MRRTTLAALVAIAAALPASAAQLVIAHRGASASAPEHTFFAYDLALAMGADMLECDLLLTKDEVPVCIHDTTVDRTSDGAGRVDSFTLAQLRALDFGSWFNDAYPPLARSEYAGARIVPLEEQLDCYLRHNPRMRFHVETKDSAGGRAEQVLANLLERKGLLATGDSAGNVRSSTLMLQSFHPASLSRMRALAPTVPTAFLYDSPANAEQLTWHATGDGPAYIDAFAPSAAALDDGTAVHRFHANGHDVHAWTVDDATAMDTLLDLGVDGIFTNKPDLLRAAIDARASGTDPAERGTPASFARGCPGVAGRVTSAGGPGDTWEPTGTRGVRRVTPSVGENPDSAGPSSATLLAGLALAVCARLRRGRSRNTGLTR